MIKRAGAKIQKKRSSGAKQLNAARQHIRKLFSAMDSLRAIDTVPLPEMPSAKVKSLLREFFRALDSLRAIDTIPFPEKPRLRKKYSRKK